MFPLPASRRRLLTAVGIALASVVLSALVGRVGFFRTLDWKLYDQLVRWTADPASARRDIVLVNIDETSLRRLEPVVGRWPWPRLVHAAVIDFLGRAPAAVVGYDVLFTEADRRIGFDVGGTTWSGAESDQALADAVRRAGNVVVLADATYEGLDEPLFQGTTAADEEGSASASPAVELTARGNGAADVLVSGPTLDESFESRPDIKLPYESLARAARSVAHNYFVLDQDGPVRRVVPFVRWRERSVPLLGVAAFEIAADVDADRITRDHDDLMFGARRAPLVVDALPRFSGAAPGQPATARRMLVDYRGPAVLPDGRTTTYRQYSFYDLFYSEQQILAGENPLINPKTFENCLVFVGVTAAGLHDTFVAPFGGGGKMPGSQIHAAVADQLLSQRYKRPLPWWSVLLVSGLVSLMAAAVFTGMRLRWAVPGLVVLVGTLVAVSTFLFAHGEWLALGTPLVAITLSAVSGLGYQYFVEGREKRAVKRLFSQYLSQDVYEQVLANPALAELGGNRREMSVLFSDIRGFTAVTERGEPEALVTQLNEYFSRMVDIVFANRGTVDKFVGDMVMALFGAPLDDAAHADHAVQTALDMVAELDRLNVIWQKKGWPVLGIGVGVNSGEMIAGNIGSEKIRSYTVIGDNVNLAARLESLNKEHGTSIIISEHTARRLSGRYDLRSLGRVVVKGKTVPVEIFQIRPGHAASRP